MLWKGILRRGRDWFITARISVRCATVDEVRRRLSEEAWWTCRTGTTALECALLAHHYHGRPYSELVYLERVRVVHSRRCARTRCV